jgi:two-component system chemotaxis response regulator CheB
LLAIRNAGGVAVAQDPSDAFDASMPQNASDIAGVDQVVPAAGLGKLLVNLLHESANSGQGDETMEPIE